MNLALLSEDLARDEGTRLVVYDDGTGAPIKPGTLVKGHPTIGIGRALDVEGISPDESTQLMMNDISHRFTAFNVYPWFKNLDDIRQNAIINMSFPVGIEGLMGFHDMIRYLSDDPPRFGLAAAAILDSLWFREESARASRIAQAIQTGEHV